MKFLLAMLSFLTVIGFENAYAMNTDFSNVQIKCVPDGGGETVFIGNDTTIDSMATEMEVYQVDGKTAKLVERSRGRLDFKTESTQVGTLSFESSKTALVVKVFVHPLSWNAGTINGASAKCIIDPQFFQSLKF